MLVAHAALETARDSLFLAGLPSTELPWVYLGVAIVAPAVTRLSDRFGSLGDPFSALLVAMSVASFGTATMSVFVVPEANWALYALYIWTGSALTLAMIRFSLLSASRFTVAQAKRVLPVVAFGTSAGGIAGFAGAGAIVGVASPYALLWLGAAAYAAAGVAAWFLLRGDSFAEPVPVTPTAVTAGIPRESLFSSTVRSLREPYVRYLSGLVVVSAITVTWTDFLFKSAVDIYIEPDRMAAFFATAYFGFSVVSLLATLLLVSPAIRRYGVTAALAVLPALLLIGSAGLAALGGISIIVAMKAFDGSLRHSLNKTAVDLLYVPMPAQLRATVKSGVDVVAQRGGQVLGALVILALEPWSNAVFLTTLGVGLGAAAWLWIVYSLRDEYLELFRRALSDGAFEAVIDYPELGEADLATVIRSLSDSNEDRVLAALELLSARGHARLVPVAILENESPKVVCEALRILVRSGRVSAIPFATRLMETGVPEVRAAAVRAIAELGPDSTTLRRAMESDDLGISTAAMVGLVGCGELDAYDAADVLGQQLDSATESERAAVAAAIATVPDRAFTPILERILREPGDEARLVALGAMREAENPMLVPAMIAAIGSRATREEARRALLVLGDIALDRLAAALRDEDEPLALRSQIPHSIARFGSDRAAGLLLRRVAEGMTDPVGYQSLRAVGRMFDEDETLETSPEGLESLIASTLCEIAELIDCRCMLFGDDADLEARSGPWLLRRALVDRQARLTECVFRILGLRYRGENLEHVHDGAVHGDSIARASAHEILYASLEHDLSSAIVALTDEISDDAKLAGLEGYYVPGKRTAEDILTSMARGTDATLAELAVYAAAERYSLDLREALTTDGPLSAVHDEAGALLSASPAGEAG